MLESPATDPGRAAEEMAEALIAELREDAEIATRCAGWVSDDSEPKPRVDEHLSWRAARTIAQLQADLIAARKERDEALERGRVLYEDRTAECETASRYWREARKMHNDLIALAKMYGEACRDLVYARSGEDDLFWQKEEAVVALSRKLVAAEEEAAQLRARLHEAEKGAEAMRDALDQAEACLSIVAPRSDKAEYLRTLGVVRAALAAKSDPPLNRSETDGGPS